MTVLPNGWVETTLGSVAEWGSGGTPKATERTYYGGGIPWAVIGDLNDGVVDRTANTLTEAGLSSSSARLVEPGTVLLAMYGSIGKLGIAGRRLATNQAIAFVNGHRGIADNKFLFWFLRWQRPMLASAGKGATQKNISQAVLKSWPIALPPIGEQERIATAIEEQFSRLQFVDSLLYSTARRLHLLRRANLDEALSIEADAVALGDVCEVAGGATPKGFAPHASGDLPFYKVGDMNLGDGVLMTSSRSYVNASEADKLRLRIWPAGTVIFPKQGGAIATNKKRVLTRPAACDLNVMGVIPGPRMTSSYLRLVLQSLDLADLSDGSVVPQIKLPTVRHIAVPLPSLDEQHAIVEATDRTQSLTDAMSVAIDHALVRSRQLGRALLGEGFSGRLVPQDPADEPASNVLASTAAQRSDAAKSRRRQRA